MRRSAKSLYFCPAQQGRLQSLYPCFQNPSRINSCRKKKKRNNHFGQAFCLWYESVSVFIWALQWLCRNALQFCQLHLWLRYSDFQINRMHVELGVLQQASCTHMHTHTEHARTHWARTGHTQPQSTHTHTCSCCISTLLFSQKSAGD